MANELVDWFNAVDLTPLSARGRLYRTDLRELNELNFARFDAKLEQRLAEARAELRQEIADFRAELRTELRTGLHSLRADLLRWMFGFWATTLLTLAGLMIALRNSYWLLAIGYCRPSPLEVCMPFKSKAQRRKFAELLVKGEISEETFEEWNRETGGARLPERVKQPAKRGKKKATAKSSRKPRRKAAKSGSSQ